jgi:hypothetical protein
MLIVAGLMLWPTPALATPFRGVGGDISVRFDGNDTLNILDIRRVATDLNRRLSLFAVETYDVFTANDIDAQQGSYFQFNLDTKRRGRADRFVYLYYWPPNDQFYCEVDTRDGRELGFRIAQFDTSTIYCAVRTSWLGVQKQVKFAVEAWNLRNFVDRAPNRGRYRGL